MLTRRRFIIVLGGVTLAGLAGCGGEEEVAAVFSPFWQIWAWNWLILSTVGRVVAG
ncbi:hypothetical protein [Halomonas campaniensis]|uniref:hypothetical protein n=1 Tax=Halomonas campaniensis TaxID=213554 RepID=UPI0039708756